MPTRYKGMTRDAGRWVLRPAFAALLLAAAFAVWTIGPKNSQAVAGPVGPTDEVTDRSSFAGLIEAVKPAVVNISVSGHRVLETGGGPFNSPIPYPESPQGTPFDQFFRRFFDGQPRTDRGARREFSGMGSGFIIDPAGYVVTNHHVIEDAAEIVVTLNDGTRFDGELVGYDDKTDLALIAIDADEPLPYVEFGDSDTVRVGDWVVAIGNPFGFGGSASAGIVSARGRDLQAGPFDDFLQIDAPINSGNSGGPLFDMSGRVVGINAAIYSPNGGNVGIGFAIPSAMAKPVIAQLRDSGHVERGWLGVSVQGLDEDLAEGFGLDAARGALVASVVNGSPADEAGLEPGDVILGLDGEPVDSPKELARQVASAVPGGAVVLEVWRQGNTRSIDVELHAAPLAADIPGKTKVAESTERRLGLALRELSEDARRNLGVAEGVTGALVSAVEPGSAAARKGLQPGDVVTMVGQRAVNSPEEVGNAIDVAVETGRENVVLQVLRGADRSFVALELS